MLEVAGVRRGYWLARGGSPETLLMVLHGSGTSGRDMATIFTGLATRGPCRASGGWSRCRRWPGPISRQLDATGILLQMI